METTRKRTRPGGQRRPDRTDKVLPPLNAPYAGCCKPYPDARFVNQVLVEINAHHIGRHCKGFLEPMDMEVWNAEVDARNARRAGRGDER